MADSRWRTARPVAVRTIRSSEMAPAERTTDTRAVTDSVSTVESATRTSPSLAPARPVPIRSPRRTGRSSHPSGSSVHDRIRRSPHPSWTTRRTRSAAAAGSLPSEFPSR